MGGPVETSKVQDFFSNQSILITGGTGFIGKVLLEKLLFSCPGIKNIYLLVRNANEGNKMSKLLNSEIFNRMKQRNPSLLSKILAIDGDLTGPDLNISHHDKQKLINNVSIIYHAGANVRFDESFKKAVEVNLLGTMKLVELFKSFISRKAFIHISTAYVNCHLSGDIKETVYKTMISPKDVMEAYYIHSVHEMEKLFRRTSEGRVNSYIYSKALTENFLAQEAKDIPVVILRPSIVTAAVKDPYEGWVDNLNAFSAMLKSAMIGRYRIIQINNNCISDLIPVDTVVNFAIVAASYLKETNLIKRNFENVPVFHCTSSSLNPFSTKHITQLSKTNIQKFPSEKAVLFPFFISTGNSVVHLLLQFFLHFLPAMVLDIFQIFKGQRLKFTRNLMNIIPVMFSMEYFARKTWIFENDNMKLLERSMSPIDFKEFSIDIKSINWDAYMEKYILGIRKYALQESNISIPFARKNAQRLKMLEITILVLFLLFFIWFLTLIF